MTRKEVSPLASNVMDCLGLVVTDLPTLAPSLISNTSSNMLSEIVLVKTNLEIKVPGGFGKETDPYQVNHGHAENE